MSTPGQLRAAIVDDEPLARARLRRLLANEEGIAVVAEFGDGISAAEGLQAIAPDVVFLDVRMPQVDGFAMLQRLPAAKRPRVVFVTASEARVVGQEVAVEHQSRLPFFRTTWVALGVGTCSVHT